VPRCRERAVAVRRRREDRLLVQRNDAIRGPLEIRFGAYTPLNDRGVGRIVGGDLL